MTNELLAPFYAVEPGDSWLTDDPLSWEDVGKIQASLDAQFGSGIAKLGGAFNPEGNLRFVEVEINGETALGRWLGGRWSLEKMPRGLFS